MDLVTDRLLSLIARKDRFIYDLRGNCQVYDGVVAAYRATTESGHFTELPLAVAHAMENDGIIGMWKQPGTGSVVFDSCRVFTDVENALRFARTQQQRSVQNLNRNEEVEVDMGVPPVLAH